MASFKYKDLMINIAPGEGVNRAVPVTVCVGTQPVSLFPCGCEVTQTVGCGKTWGHIPMIFLGGNPDPLPWAMGARGPAAALFCGHTYRSWLCCGWCTNATDLCGGISNPVTVYLNVCPTPTVIGPVGVPPGGDPAALSQQLAAVKVQLQKALAEIETEQAAVDASLQPQTVAQVEELQGKMREALAELERRKAELERK